MGIRAQCALVKGFLEKGGSSTLNPSPYALNPKLKNFTSGFDSVRLPHLKHVLVHSETQNPAPSEKNNPN